MSREAKKKQHACASSGLHDYYSELFTRMAVLKLYNAVTEPLEQILLLRNYLPNMFYLGRIGKPKLCKSVPKLLLISHS